MGLLDTEVFPRTNLYDINIYVDDEDYLYVNAYQLVWVEEGKDKEGYPHYTFANDSYADAINLLGLDLAEPETMTDWGLTRHTIPMIADTWTTTSGLETDFAGVIPDEMLKVLREQIEIYCVAYEASVDKHAV
jgi:hypothetical protein